MKRRYFKRWYDAVDDTTTSEVTETKTVDEVVIDVVETKTEKPAEVIEEVPVKDDTVQVNEKTKDPLKDVLSRLEALETENKNLKKQAIMNTVPSDTLQVLKDKGIDYSGMDTKSLKVLADSLKLVSNAKPINNVKPNNTLSSDVSEKEAFMKAWDKEMGRS